MPNCRCSRSQAVGGQPRIPPPVGPSTGGLALSGGVTNPAGPRSRRWKVLTAPRIGKLGLQPLQFDFLLVGKVLGDCCGLVARVGNFFLVSARGVLFQRGDLIDITVANGVRFIDIILALALFGDAALAQGFVLRSRICLNVLGALAIFAVVAVERILDGKIFFSSTLRSSSL